MTTMHYPRVSPRRNRRQSRHMMSGLTGALMGLVGESPLRQKRLELEADMKRQLRESESQHREMQALVADLESKIVTLKMMVNDKFGETSPDAMKIREESLRVLEPLQLKELLDNAWPVPKDNN